MTTATPADVTSWQPDLTDMTLTDLSDWDPGDALGELLARVDRPSSQVAGSSGS